MDEKEITLHEILMKEEELKNLNALLNIKEQEIQQLKKKIENLDKDESPEQIKEIEKELKSEEDKFSKFKKDLNNITEEILRLRNLIEKDNNSS